jgi:hypothetical protein
MLRNMRSFLLATLAAIAIPACTNDITGGGGGGSSGGGGDDGDTCSCPDGSTLPAGECATECPAPSSGAGSIAVATDLATYPGQLNSAVTATVTVTGSEGFSGLVTLAATVTDSTGAAITEWPVTLDNTMVSVTENGTASAKATIMIPTTAIPSSDATSMAGSLKITATPMATTVTAQSTTAALAIANTLEIDMSVVGGACVFPQFVLAGPVNIAVGTVVNWKNTGANAATTGFVIHVDTNSSGIAHQGEGAPALAPNETGGSSGGTPNPVIWPEDVTAVVSGKVTWHCHAPDDSNAGAANLPVGFTVSMPQ